MIVLRGIALSLTLFLFAGCTIPGQGIQKELANYKMENPTPQSFKHCFGYGCTKSEMVGLSADEWARVTSHLRAMPATARDERRNLAYSIAEMERIVGAKTGTDKDKPGSFQAFAAKDQLDCVDEMLNTGTYLTLFDREGLLRIHRPHRRVTQSFFHNAFWTHTVATILDPQTDQEYIIDMWKLEHGKAPYVMEFEAWDDGQELANAY